jgi:hypothetical protein
MLVSVLETSHAIESNFNHQRSHIERTSHEFGGTACLARFRSIQSSLATMSTRSALLTLDEMIAVVGICVYFANGDRGKLVQLIERGIRCGLFVLPPPSRSIPKQSSNIMELSPNEARVRFRFDCATLSSMSTLLGLPNEIVTSHRDRMSKVDALALLCRRLAEPCRWSTLEKEFGRSSASMSRIFVHTLNLIYVKFKDRIAWDERVFRLRATLYCEAIAARCTSHCSAHSDRQCVGFIDGVKQFIARPSPRAGGPRDENLQQRTQETTLL